MVSDIIRAILLDFSRSRTLVRSLLVSPVIVDHVESEIRPFRGGKPTLLRNQPPNTFI